ncbi:hypothetical protein ES703_112504 [subsurface metagenome]
MHVHGIMVLLFLLLNVFLVIFPGVLVVDGNGRLTFLKVQQSQLRISHFMLQPVLAGQVRIQRVFGSRMWTMLVLLLVQLNILGAKLTGQPRLIGIYPVHLPQAHGTIRLI